ncbi:DUF3383 family protein [Asaia sp. HumB]|uniref:DUF3383 family protein n=1 Tax=Asaia sp. HumB TaxID=3035475 RepID=UPI0025530B28|nr:DUF3383 family protein [Asaia sp. HumB]MDL2169789.1 DUF3383 family protein [Asaia sp. HumB]
MAVGTPISLVVSVVPGTIPANGTLDFLNGLVITADIAAVPNGTTKVFYDLASVGVTFGTSSNEYKIAEAYFVGYDNALQFPATLYFAGYGPDSTPASFMSSDAITSLPWTGFTTAYEPDLATKQAFATWTGAQNAKYWYVPWDTDTAASTQGSTASFGAWLVAQDLTGTSPVYMDPAAAGAFLGWMAALNFDQVNGRQNLAFTSNGQVTPATYSAATAATLLANGYNWYGQFSGRAGSFNWVYNGSVSGPFLWADSYINQIWINALLQYADASTLTNFGNVPFNTQGDAIISAGRKSVISQALSYGAIQTGVAISDSQKLAINRFFGVDSAADSVVNQGYYEQPGASTATSANRAARTIPASKFAYADGQSVQMITLLSREVI